MALSHRSPPSVVYPLARSRVLGALLVAILGMGGVVLTAWVVHGRGSGVVGWPAAAVWAAALAGVAHFWWNQPQGSLHWDGRSWTMDIASSEAPSAAAAILSAPPEVLLDLQSHLWVKVCPRPGTPAWIWLARSVQPERWMDLRRAVYSRARPGADNADEAAPASSRGA